ncbi:MAG: hypothetical protein PHX61_02230 [Alphaproteobacteria bacterium]|nr:hypothetical protein [Alphaproteobacteria bacterium]
MKYLLALLICGLCICSYVSAVPTASAATAISSNGFNTTISGSSGNTWISWGDYPGKENWMSVVASGDGTIQVIGAPIYGGERIYFRPCDSTGCGAEQTVTIPTITPVPTTTFKKLLSNITDSRFAPDKISQSLLSGYTQVTPPTVLFGIAFVFIMFGIWYRTKSVRLIAVLGILISPFIMYGSNGLYLGIPSLGIGIAQGLLAAGVAGVLFSFIRK